MGLIAATKDTLANALSTEVMKQRLAFAEDKLKTLEGENLELERQNAVLEAKLSEAQSHIEELRQQAETLEAAQKEPIVIASTVEFRRSERTRHQWLPFCPVCHAPAGHGGDPSNFLICSHRSCAWMADISHRELPSIIAGLG
jgi:hypothetical protein